MATRHQRAGVQCHYCDDAALLAIEHDHVRVGLCETHLRERLSELSDAGWLEEIESVVDDAEG